MSLTFRHAGVEHLPHLLALAHEARLTMRRSGNMNQWINGYPDTQVFMRDIEHRCSYIAIDENGNIVATFAFMPGPEPTYANIYEGQWLDSAHYFVIHRIAGSTSRRGILKEIINYCLTVTDNIRIDTHRDNVIMRHLLEKLNFTYCGIIYLNDGAERLAYQYCADR